MADEGGLPDIPFRFIPNPHLSNEASPRFIPNPLVADDVVPESPLPDRDIAPDVFGLFISMGEAEFDGLHEIGNGWIGFDRPPWCIVGQVAKLPDGSNRICRALGSGSSHWSQPDLRLAFDFFSQDNQQLTNSLPPSDYLESRP